MAANNLRGSIVPLVTPFDAGGALDERRFVSLIEFQLSSGSHGISVTGTTGEPSSLSLEERERLFALAVDTVGGRKPVVAGTGTNNLKETVSLTRYAEDTGANAALVIVPYYIRPSQEGLFVYFSSVASSTDLPVIIYNIPGRTAANIEPATVRRLKEENSNVVGIKESNRDLDQVTKVLQECGSDFLVYSGIESLCYPMLALGGAGHFSATANILPRELADLYNLASEQRWSEAKDLHYRLFRINEAIFWETNPVPLKCAMSLMGLISNVLRPPLVPLQQSKSIEMKRLLADYGIVQGDRT